MKGSKEFRRKGTLYGMIFILIVLVTVYATMSLTGQLPVDKTNNGATSAAVSSTPSSADSSVDVEDDKTPRYRMSVEDRIEEIYQDGTVVKVHFDTFANYREWVLDGLSYVENQYTVTYNTGLEVRHRYLARVADGTLFFLSIDGETIYWDEDGETAFLDGQE